MRIDPKGSRFPTMKISTYKSVVAAALLAITVCASAPGSAPEADRAGTTDVAGAIEVTGGLIANPPANNGVRAFKAIPYAAPPVGSLRWVEPRTVVPWTGVREVDAYGPGCMQTPYPPSDVYPDNTESYSEDCLFLNVWTGAESPADSNAGSSGDARPVMVWIHGGSNTRGSGSYREFDGSALARKGVVVVTVNYRLNIFGFLAHPELTAESPNHSSGNYAILDQIAALKWVRDNIAAFGGDPDRVTILGESSGAGSVSILLATPLAKGLFHRAIGQSGGVFGPMARLNDPDPESPSAESAGLRFAASAHAQSIEDLRGLSAEELLEIASRGPGGSGVPPRVNVDGWLLHDEVHAIFAAGSQNDVPLIVGSNADEMTSLTPRRSIPADLAELREWFEEEFGARNESEEGMSDGEGLGRAEQIALLYPAATDAEAARSYLNFQRDRFFTGRARTWARAQASGRAPAFLYFFRGPAPSLDRGHYGAFHAGEIAFIFGTHARMPHALEDADQRLSEAMSSYWVNFATAGDPNGEGLPEWPAYDTGDGPDDAGAEAYMSLGEEVRSGTHLLQAQLDFLQGPN